MPSFEVLLPLSLLLAVGGGGGDDKEAIVEGKGARRRNGSLGDGAAAGEIEGVGGGRQVGTLIDGECLLKTTTFSIIPPLLWISQVASVFHLSEQQCLHPAWTPFSPKVSQKLPHLPSFKPWAATTTNPPL